MPPQFKFTLTINQAYLDTLRQLPDRAQRNLRKLLVTEVGPQLQEATDALFEQGPAVSSPFAFGTEPSRYHYFKMIREDPDLTAGLHWVRHPEDEDSVEKGFWVKVSDRLRGALITVTNIHPKAKYVFGPWLVPGHGNTGWPEQAVIARMLLHEKAMELIRDAYLRALAAAKKGREL